jgi:hypothetical protein
MQTHPSIRWPPAYASLVLSVTRKGKGASPRAQRSTLSNEFRNFKTAYGTRVGASVREYGTSLRDSLGCARTDGGFESIEDVWPERLRSRGSCLHSHRQ